MDWNGHQLTIPFVPPQESSFNFLLRYNHHHHQFPGMERRHVVETPHSTLSSSITDKKKRLNSDQLESLENSFQEEIKLDPDRKMKLAKELGLQPRQIAVWFQNRRARWRAKQLQNMYNALKQEFDVVCREKQNLQQEVVTLREIMKREPEKKKVSGRKTEISGGDETVDSTCLSSSHYETAEGSRILNVDEYNALMMKPLPPYWSCFPPCMPIMEDSHH